MVNQREEFRTIWEKHREKRFAEIRKRTPQPQRWENYMDKILKTYGFKVINKSERITRLVKIPTS